MARLLLIGLLCGGAVLGNGCGSDLQHPGTIEHLPPEEPDSPKPDNPYHPDDDKDPDMASKGPPDGIRVLQGDWGTHFDRDETIEFASGASIKIDPSSATSDLILATDWYPLPNTAPTRVRRTINAWSHFYATANGAGDSVIFDVQYAEKNRTTISTQNIHTGPLLATSLWLNVGKSVSGAGFNGRWVRLRVTVPSTSTGLYYWGAWPAEMVTPYGHYIQRAAQTDQTLTVGSWVTFDITDAVNFLNHQSGVGQDTSGDQWILYEPGWYAINVSIPLREVADGDMVIARVVYTDLNNVTQYLYGDTVSFSAAYNRSSGAPARVGVSGVFFNGISPNTIQVELRQLTGTAVSTSVADDKFRAGIVKIGG